MYLLTEINNLDNLFESHIPSPTSATMKKRSFTLAKVVEDPQGV